MKNKEFQEILKQYPDEIEVFVDKSFGWNIPTNEGYVEPYIYEHSVEGDSSWGIEIAPEGFAPMNTETIWHILNCAAEHNLITGNISDETVNNILKTFNTKYWGD